MSLSMGVRNRVLFSPWSYQTITTEHNCQSLFQGLWTPERHSRGQTRTPSALIIVLKDDTGHQITLHVCETHSKNKDTYKGEAYNKAISLTFGFFFFCNRYVTSIIKAREWTKIQNILISLHLLWWKGRMKNLKKLFMYLGILRNPTTSC